MTTTNPDIDFIRSQFPAFSEPSLQGQAHFENAGGSYACQQVINRLHDYYCRTKVQPYHLFKAATEAGQQMDQAHERMAEYLGVKSDEVHFGPSTSQNTTTLAQAFRGLLKPGDEIIVTNQDHEANSGVWRKLASDGMVIREWGVDADSGQLDLTQLDVLINDKTRLLTFPHCSNIVGHINPVAEICAKAKAAGIHTVVDGVSYAGHGFPDVGAFGADIYLFSLYKTYGPHQGVMVVREALAGQLGNQGHFFNEGMIHKQFVPAGPDHAQVAAANGVAEYFDALHQHHFSGSATSQQKAQQVRGLLHQAEHALMPELLDYLGNRKDVRVLGPGYSADRAATISFISRKKASHEIGAALGKLGIMAGTGHFYAYRLMKAMGEDPDQGTVRLSFVHYTSGAEMQQLLRALDEVL